MNDEQYGEAERRLMENSEEEAYLLECARIGIDMSLFAKTPGAKAAMDMAMKDLQDGLIALLDEPSPTTAAAIEAHADARKALGAMDYIKQAITAGKIAEERLQELDEGEGL